MQYEYEQQATASPGQDVADIYIVRGGAADTRPELSPELLAALERLSPAARDTILQLAAVGFQTMVRK